MAISFQFIHSINAQSLLHSVCFFIVNFSYLSVNSKCLALQTTYSVHLKPKLAFYFFIFFLFLINSLHPFPCFNLFLINLNSSQIFLNAFIITHLSHFLKFSDNTREKAFSALHWKSYWHGCEFWTWGG